jgi:hypothetical protein
MIFVRGRKADKRHALFKLRDVSTRARVFLGQRRAPVWNACREKVKRLSVGVYWADVKICLGLRWRSFLGDAADLRAEVP